jgi:hypothetical protein
VYGIEISEAMVAELRTYPGAAAIGVTVGDFATATVDRTFRVAYLVRNTITNLTGQDEQVACFRNAAAHLEPGGTFVIECYVPELRRLPPGETVHVFDHSPTHVAYEEYDVVTQLATSHHHWFDGDRVDSYAATHRYVWPAELDLMAQLAGMTLRDRFEDWHRAPFTGESRHHIATWEKPA